MEGLLLVCAEKTQKSLKFIIFIFQRRGWELFCAENESVESERQYRGLYEIRWDWSSAIQQRTLCAGYRLHFFILTRRHRPITHSLQPFHYELHTHDVVWYTHQCGAHLVSTWPYGGAARLEHFGPAT